jgi:hypothetical protein
LLEIIQKRQTLYIEQLFVQKHNVNANIDINVRNTVNDFKTYLSCKEAVLSYIDNKYKLVFCVLKDQEKASIEQILSSYELQEKNADIKYINFGLANGLNFMKGRIVLYQHQKY